MPRPTDPVNPTTQTAPTALPPRSFWANLLRLPTPTRARMALQALIASAPIDQVSQAAVEQVRRDNRVSRSAMHDVCYDIFKDAYRTAVADNVLTDAEVDHLTRLRHLLVITKAEVAEVEQKTILPRYQAAVDRVLADGRLSEDERASLDALAAGLRLPPDTARATFVAAATTLLESVLESSLADRRFTDEESETFNRLAMELGVRPHVDDATLRTMQRASQLWRIEQGDIPALAVALNLQKGEVCHFQAPARWLEYRTQTTTVGYYSQGVSIRVMRGVSYRVGASRPHRVTTEGLTTVDTGDLYLTNKRVIFTGTRRNLTLRLASLLAFDVYDDGFTLEKTSGKSPHFVLTGDAELANVILGAVLARS